MLYKIDFDHLPTPNDVYEEVRHLIADKGYARPNDPLTVAALMVGDRTLLTFSFERFDYFDPHLYGGEVSIVRGGRETFDQYRDPDRLLDDCAHFVGESYRRMYGKL